MLRPGIYPLIIFTHGNRSGDAARHLCPPDLTRNYQRWTRILRLFAQCGFVVVSPDVHNTFSSIESTAERIEATVRWMRREWFGRHTLHLSSNDPTLPTVSGQSNPQPDEEEYSSEPPELLHPLGRGSTHTQGWPTPLGLVGHSWGAKASAIVAQRRQVRVRALAAIAGTFDTSQAFEGLIDARIPTLLLSGTTDSEAYSYLNGLWPLLIRPKHQAALKDLGHWDWFGYRGAIRPCNPGTEPPTCPIGGQIASELVLGFMTKYLRKKRFIPPFLLGDEGDRPPLLPWLEDDDAVCAVQIRWDDPLASAPYGTRGVETLGGWDGQEPW